MRIYGWFFLGVVGLTLGACSWEKKETKLDPDAPVKVQVPVYTEGTYRMEVVELRTLSSLNDLKGAAAKFLLDANTSSGSLRGRSPHIRYMRDSNDVIVAQDDLSLQLLTLYAHIEKLKNLDDAVGAKGVLSYPRTVAVNARFRSSQGLMENNAIYTGQYDALLVVPYTEGDLPLMANAGVVAHEHFHALFQKLVVEPLKDKYPDFKHATVHLVENSVFRNISREMESPKRETSLRDHYHAALMRGVNEGLADFWGWIYSGDDSFVGRSLPQEKINRELDIVPDDLFSKEVLLKVIQNAKEEKEILSASYDHGTQLARALRNYSKLYAKGKKQSLAEVRPQMAQIVTVFLPAFQKKFETLKDDEYMTLGQVAVLFTEQVKDMHSDECYSIAKLMPGGEEKSSKLGEKCRLIETQEKGGKP